MRGSLLILLVLGCQQGHVATPRRSAPSVSTARAASAAPFSSAAPATSAAPAVASDAARASAATAAQVSRRVLHKLVAGPGGKACRFSLEYPELRGGDDKLDRAVNRQLAPAKADFHCTAEDVVWSGDNGLSGSGLPAPAVFERTGAYVVLFNDQQLLAVQLTLSADVGMAHGVMLRDDVLVLDLAHAGRVVPLSEVVDRTSHPEAWSSLVQAAMNRALAPDLSVAEWVTNLTSDSDRYALSGAGITLCPNGLPSALAALESCSYTVFWAELSPLWVAGNPLERVRRAAAAPTTPRTRP